MLREQDKHFLASLYAGVAVILVWKGLWEGLYEIPYVGEPFIALFIGFAMLTFSGLFFKEFDPLGSIQSSARGKILSVQNSSEKKHFKIIYTDKKQRKKITVSANDVERIEHDAMVIHNTKAGKEVFIPIHRVSEILFKGKKYWRM